MGGQDQEVFHQPDPRSDVASPMGREMAERRTPDIRDHVRIDPRPNVHA